MTTRRLLAPLALGLLLLAGAVHAGIPAEVARLVPAESSALVVVSSAAEFEAEWSAMLDAAGAGPEMPRTLDAMLEDGVPIPASLLGRDGPIVLALDAGPVMMGGQPGMTFVFPAAGDLEGIDLSGDVSGFTHVHRFGDFGVLTADPAYAPRDDAEAIDVVDGVIALSLDIQGTLGRFLPLAMMGLGQMTVAKPDSLGNPGEPAMTQAQVDLVAQAMQDLVTAAQRFELALRRDGDHVVFAERLRVTPDGPLAPGAQPDFDRARELTRVLPAGSHLVKAAAVDLTRPFEFLKPLYMMNFEESLADVPEEHREAVRGWFENYLDVVEWTAAPMVAGATFGDDGLALHAALETEQSAAVFGGLVALADATADLPLPFRLEAVSSGDENGASIHSYRTVIDRDALGHDAADLDELAKVEGLLSRILGHVHVGHTDGAVLVSASPTAGPLGGMIQAYAGGKGQADPRLAGAAALGEEGVQQVMVGDLGHVLAWAMEMAAEMGEEEVPMQPGEIGRIPMSQTLSVTPDGYAATVALPRDDLLRLITFMAENED